MLDFGFSEILLTSAIALVVLGPERLPKVARQVGNWMGRARAMARQLSEQLEREVSADELLKAKAKFENQLMAPLPNRIASPQYVNPDPDTPALTSHAEYEPPPVSAVPGEAAAVADAALSAEQTPDSMHIHPASPVPEAEPAHTAAPAVIAASSNPPHE
jgi:Tat protein translocase TatB subunit